MAQTIHEQYLESEVLGADPVKLIAILFRAASESVAAARRHLADREIRERSRQITKAWEILTQLATSLDPQRGGEISRRLAGLYDYMRAQLIAANAGQIDAPLAEVERLLTTLSDAWKSVPAPVTPMPIPVSLPDSEYVPLSCTF